MPSLRALLEGSLDGATCLAEPREVIHPGHPRRTQLPQLGCCGPQIIPGWVLHAAQARRAEAPAATRRPAAASASEESPALRGPHTPRVPWTPRPLCKLCGGPQLASSRLLLPIRYAFPRRGQAVQSPRSHVPFGSSAARLFHPQNLPRPSAVSSSVGWFTPRLLPHIPPVHVRLLPGPESLRKPASSGSLGSPASARRSQAVKGMFQKKLSGAWAFRRLLRSVSALEESRVQSSVHTAGWACCFHDFVMVFVTIGLLSSRRQTQVFPIWRKRRKQTSNPKDSRRVTAFEKRKLGSCPACAAFLHSTQ